MAFKKAMTTKNGDIIMAMGNAKVKSKNSHKGQQMQPHAILNKLWILKIVTCTIALIVVKYLSCTLFIALNSKFYRHKLPLRSNT